MENHNSSAVAASLLTLKAHFIKKKKNHRTVFGKIDLSKSAEKKPSTNPLKHFYIQNNLNFQKATADFRHF